MTREMTQMQIINRMSKIKKPIIEETTKTAEPVTHAITEPVIENLQNSQVTTELEPPVAGNTLGKEKYHASIEQDEQGITIILNAPKTVDLDLQVESEAESTTSEHTSKPADTAQVKEESAAKPDAIQSTELKISPPVREPRKVEIIHIVVKGDTLWHIAKRYVDNPFLYPELARLSNIKNPHRIYPGNRVRIIRYLD